MIDCNLENAKCLNVIRSEGIRNIISVQQKTTNLKGVILSGGSGTRLQPISMGISKQLMPIYDKTIIYYPSSTLLLAGIKDVLIITTPENQNQFKRLLKDSSQWGYSITYSKQKVPNCLAQAFVIGADFIAKNIVALILGNNIFYSGGFGYILR